MPREPWGDESLLPVPDCADETKPWGVVRFIHKDGKEHEFWTAVNGMTGARLSAFDCDPPDVGESLVYLRTVFRDIHAKAVKVLKWGGKLAAPPEEVERRKRKKKSKDNAG